MVLENLNGKYKDNVLHRHTLSFTVLVLYIFLSELVEFHCFQLSKMLHFIFVIYFNLRIIALQYRVGFCHTSTGTSHRCIYVPLILKSLLPHSLR